MKRIKIDGDPGKHWFTSDTHFGHANILRYCERPWPGIIEHDQALVENWNSVVSPGDTVWHLGDFCFGGSDRWSRLFERLNGDIRLVLGNHDASASESMLANGPTEVYPGIARLWFQADSQEIWLSHFPLATWPGAWGGRSWNLHGHVHSRELPLDARPGQYDVGVDLNGYRPVCYTELARLVPTGEGQ